jgi:O-acetylserine/cysteine efflux transporter
MNGFDIFLLVFVRMTGLFVIGKGTLASRTTVIPAAAVILMLGAPLFWSLSNIVARFASEDASARGEKLDMMGLVVWSGLIPPVPLLMFSMFIYSPQRIFDAIIGLNPVSIFAVLYLGLAATLFGFGFWNILLSKYSFAKISPLSLLVPVTGFLTSRIVLKEVLSAMQLIGITFIIAGLVVTNVDIKSLKKSKA